jgi:hypothetical protein
MKVKRAFNFNCLYRDIRRVDNHEDYRDKNRVDNHVIKIRETCPRGLPHTPLRRKPAPQSLQGDGRARPARPTPAA